LVEQRGNKSNCCEKKNQIAVRNGELLNFCFNKFDASHITGK